MMGGTSRTILAWSLTGSLAVMLLWAALQPEPVWQGGPPGVDKLQQITSFTAVILPIALLLPAHLVKALALLLAVGGMIELVQPLVGREASWLDMGANGLGIALGSVPGLLAYRRGRRDASAPVLNARYSSIVKMLGLPRRAVHVTI